MKKKDKQTYQVIGQVSKTLYQYLYMTYLYTLFVITQLRCDEKHSELHLNWRGAIRRTKILGFASTLLGFLSEVCQTYEKFQDNSVRSLEKWVQSIYLTVRYGCSVSRYILYFCAASAVVLAALSVASASLSLGKSVCQASLLAKQSFFRPDGTVPQKSITELKKEGKNIAVSLTMASCYLTLAIIASTIGIAAPLSAIIYLSLGGIQMSRSSHKTLPLSDVPLSEERTEAHWTNFSLFRPENDMDVNDEFQGNSIGLFA